MKTVAFLVASAFFAAGPASLSCASPHLVALGYGCCKICHKGKACGDSCISRDKECHKAPGCACDG